MRMRTFDVIRKMSRGAERDEVRSFLKERLFSPVHDVEDGISPPPSAQQALRWLPPLLGCEHKASFVIAMYPICRVLVHLLKRSVVHGEGNSVLLTGPRGVGKSWVGHE